MLSETGVPEALLLRVFTESLFIFVQNLVRLTWAYSGLCWKPGGRGRRDYNIVKGQLGFRFSADKCSITLISLVVIHRLFWAGRRRVQICGLLLLRMTEEKVFSDAKLHIPETYSWLHSDQYNPNSPWDSGRITHVALLALMFMSHSTPLQNGHKRAVWVSVNRVTACMHDAYALWSTRSVA